MTHFKRKPLLSLLLAMVMVVTMLPMTALAAEETDIPAAEVCTDEHCTHEHEPAAPTDVYTVQPDAEVTLPEPEADEIPAVPETAPETPVASGDYPFTWVVDAEGTLYITGNGYVEPFYSPEEQPWRDIREQIHSVRFDLGVSLEIIDLCYWFDGCINLSDAAIPVYVCQIAPLDFAGCSSLSRLTYGGVDVLAEMMADYSNQTGIELAPDTDLQDDGISLFSSSSCGILQCTCTGSCSWGYRNYRVAPESNNYHIMTVYCATCGKTDGIIVTGSHSFRSNGYCSLCGYYNSAYDTTICYHSSTRQTWVTSCRWERYCTNCGAYVSSGTTHGPYDYGAWQYYSASQHRRSYTCTYGDSGTYTEYGNHSTSTSYSPYSATQHSVQSYCSTCSSYVGSASYASHSFSYGSWQSYDGTQHRRSVSCATCGYSSYEYAGHSLTSSAWASISDTQHQRTNSCSCGYSATETANHSLTHGAWASVSDTQHRRTLSCSCGYSTTETANHSLAYGAWAAISDTQHQRSGSCTCGYSANDTGAHDDADDDGYCDTCEYLMTRFSVTVPASLSLTVSEHGEVYAANNAAIINNSTGAVEVTGVTLTAANGWTLVPYNYNMAAAQVNSKLIGFALNGAVTGMSGLSENLSLPGGWTIAKATALPLSYDAVVSATSSAILSEQVLSIVFIIEWAGV